MSLSSPPSPTSTTVDSSLGNGSQADTLSRLELDTLLGLPIEGTVDNSIDAFRHQIPDHTDQQTYFLGPYGPYSARTLYYTKAITMEDKALVIGSKSSFAQHSKKRKPAKSLAHRPKIVSEVVQVTQGDAVIDKVPLTLLTRFSRVAKAKWPKPVAVKTVPNVVQNVQSAASKVAQKTGVDDAETAAKTDTAASAPASRAWADTAEDVQIDISDLVEGATKSASKDSVEQSSRPTRNSVATSPAAAEPKTLDLFLEGVDKQPTPASFRFVLRWMHSNKGTRHDEPLTSFSDVALGTVKLEKLVDVYAAALTFDVCPFPHVLCQHILQRITQTPSSLDDFRFISYRLPLNDTIVTRMLTAHFEHASAGAYPEGVAEAIENFVMGYDQDMDYLLYWDRLAGIKRSFDYRQRQERKEHAQQEKQKILREAFDEFAGPDALLDTPAAQPAKGDKPTQKTTGADTPDGRRRNRRAQQHNGRGNQEVQPMKQTLGQLPWVIKPAAKAKKGSAMGDAGEVSAKTKVVQ
ncbi:hypothetical protein B0A48_05221 [Cryoendolithus antarcticus]|uniref:BTB domain-containing protein n=1 Tax=Cryoendolithus antarcticus TaxID=1507870 RepID=A0A1V8THX8_9PEZI|nr:hypothetical protein B0A48_05221 [Cryoendolithus antarcticus]